VLLLVVVGMGLMSFLKNRPGTLVVKVTEPGVQLWIDGEAKGAVDATMVARLSLPPGEHRLTVKRGEQEVYAASFSLKGGGEEVIDAKLAPVLAIAPFDADRARAHQIAWAEHLGVSVEQTNLIGMKLAVIPPGKFVMGSPPSAVGRDPVEGPQHEVTIARPFFMGVHEVTVGQFAKFVASAKYDIPKGGFSGPAVGPSPMVHWTEPGWVQTNHFPVTCVSWDDANAFCQWLSDKEKQTYRLPTEAEWEYACRAGADAGPALSPASLSAFAWYAANSDGKYHEVGTKKPNAWGLYDMLGNVMEWTLDRYAPYQPGDAVNPWVRAVAPYPHAVRGGSWNDPAAQVTCTARVPSDASWKQQDPQLPKSIWYMTDAPWLGFRLVRPARVPGVEEMYRYWNNGVEHDER
jgi:formylglycine-generating enzyme required for sulfatase activity